MTFQCDETSSRSEVRFGLRVGLQKKKTQKLTVHACACADNGGEKRNVLIVAYSC